jgi:hypothetical protein
LTQIVSFFVLLIKLGLNLRELILHGVHLLLLVIKLLLNFRLLRLELDLHLSLFIHVEPLGVLDLQLKTGDLFVLHHCTLIDPLGKPFKVIYLLFLQFYLVSFLFHIINELIVLSLHLVLNVLDGFFHLGDLLFSNRSFVKSGSFLASQKLDLLSSFGVGVATFIFDQR